MMLNSLTKGLSVDRKESVAEQARESRLLQEQMIRVLEEKKSMCQRKRTRRRTYLMPAWKEYQADCNGYLRGIEEQLELLKSL